MNLDFERIYIEKIDFYGKESIERHIDRYKWAMTYLSEKDSVIDFCCGTGYGTRMIAGKCKKEVLGLDINKEAIDYAKKNYEKENFKYSTDDFTNISSLFYLSHLKFNAITFIEAIEHFTDVQIANILFAFKRILPLGGKLILTTPDKAQSDGTNKFHVREYTQNELTELISKYFKLVEVKMVGKFIYLVAKNG